MGGKHRHRQALDLSKKYNIPVKQNKEVKKEKHKTISHSYYLNSSQTDLLHYAYEIDLNGNYQKVVDVSYSVLINNKWYLVVRYDSEHGYLHRHMRLSVSNPDELRSIVGVKQKGTPHNWLTWARKNIATTYLDYRIGFFRRSRLKDPY